ncbi:AraC family transcriptional regulator [Pseudomonas sp. G11-1]|uniref:AraC family transcriptional regulator n=1 Tax=Halopseudomonas bauzanensis TaxID=653930 RepID=A0A1H9SM01_9GAMM|nr:MULTISPECIES: helix-turn-helix transcriptional regulator [Halopseudomonas]MCO5787013.1 AraC family transcriptional regulator [Pseudomonas sp. G11-1]MCO5790239.1 AraC family transcriptional regulator [Pseudomonas sp. G11-2]TKA92905.1 AraC family transcriptional regulator [Halopseudomonas bauzanensis]WGK61619.1 helix-turn-helix transcriptional regulator [Halopseudomonas sp. SMJS2]SER85319.1 transcriptional regulator, AraC family [Halopseudomonas bauzanensis]
MSRNGQSSPVHRPVPKLPHLPRPLYARVESLARPAATDWHSHPWAQLSYATQGVLSVHTQTGRFLAPPQRAILVPPDMPHAVLSSPRTEMRSLYLEPQVVGWAEEHCLVLEITPLLRELISAFGQVPAEYALDGADARLVDVLLDQLRVAPRTGLFLPWPGDPRLQAPCEQLYQSPEHSVSLQQWSRELGISEKTLSRIFLRETGIGFRAWYQRLRLLHALPLLDQGQSVTDVALACGYDSTSAFIAAFRQQLGITPGALAGRVGQIAELAPAD